MDHGTLLLGDCHLLVDHSTLLLGDCCLLVDHGTLLLGDCRLLVDHSTLLLGDCRLLVDHGTLLLHHRRQFLIVGVVRVLHMLFVLCWSEERDLASVQQSACVSLLSPLRMTQTVSLRLQYCTASMRLCRG